MEWTCLDWNKGAQDKYERMGARRLSEWLLYRLDRAGIDQYAARKSSAAKEAD
jgi:hypothetical protein